MKMILTVNSPGISLNTTQQVLRLATGINYDSLSEGNLALAIAAKDAAVTAQGGAEAAEAGAETAQGAAEAARDAAVVAQGLSESAAGAAVAAETGAVAAQGAAESARDAAVAAQDGAEAALADLNVTLSAATAAAQSGAETARDAAQAAQGLSESAAGAAVAAQDGAEAAEGSAVAAQGAAEAARDAAQVAQGLSESAAGAAVAAEAGAETAQGAAESARDAAVAAQDGAETAETDAVLAQGYAQEWANRARGSLVPAAAGGDEVDDYSARHFAETAADSQAISAANAQAAIDAKLAAQAAQAGAVQVVTGGTASLTPAASKIPLANTAGKIDNGWLDPLPAMAAQALHRSPNAVTALCVYDTSKDSDGGAWTERCQHTSWYNEPLCAGTWRGAIGGANVAAAETTARAITGAATGDFFQFSGDGKFYSLNAGSGTTEVFRGNKASFPKLVAVVAEAGSVTIYDLMEPGNPMWMRFVHGSINGSSHLSFASILAVPNCLFSLNGYIVIGMSYGGLLVNFAKDTTSTLYNQNVLKELKYPAIGKRNFDRLTANSVYGTGGNYLIASPTINSISMTVLPDATLDQSTGLKIPTIAVATSAGISIIQNTGNVVSTGLLAMKLFFVGEVLCWNAMSSPVYFSLKKITKDLTASFSADIGFYRQADGAASGYYPLVGNTTSLLSLAASRKRAFFSGSIAGSFLEGVIYGLPVATYKSKSLYFALGNLFNAGYVLGDVRRCYLSSVVSESVNTPSTVLDRSYRGASATVYGAINKRVFMPEANPVPPPGMTLSWDTVDGAAVGGETFQAVVAGLDSWVNNGDGTFSAISLSGKLLQTTPAGGAGIMSGRKVRVVYTITGYSGGGSVRVEPFGASTATYRSANGTYTEDIVAGIGGTHNFRTGASAFTGTVSLVSIKEITPVLLNATERMVAYQGFSDANYLREPNSANLDFGTGELTASAWCVIFLAPLSAGTIADRSYSSGASITLGVDATGKLTATAYDGTTTRTVTTSAAYNTGTWLKARANYRAGRLSLLVNGIEVAATVGAPLLTLNNANAVLTIGNNYALNAPFPGLLALVKIGATVPTAEQALWMYEQEKHLFNPGNKCVLPDSGAIVDLAYDDLTDTFIAVSAANKSKWCGLVRTAVTPVPAGSYARCEAKAGVELDYRSTTTVGVDITRRQRTLEREFQRRTESRNLDMDTVVFEFDCITFTATTASGSNAITSVAGVTPGASHIGMKITGTGIPIDTTIIGYNGTTFYLDKNATANGSGVTMGQADFVLPVGYSTRGVMVNGTQKREGSTKDFTRLNDGFRETVRFGTSPGVSAWVYVRAYKEVA